MRVQLRPFSHLQHGTDIAIFHEEWPAYVYLFRRVASQGASMNNPPHVDPSQMLRTMIQWDGIQSGLQYLNSLSQHRYTGLFLFDGNMLKNTFIFDRQSAFQTLFPEKPASHSYCLNVKHSGQPFRVDNAPLDQRVQDHPSRDAVRSYCGVPLRDRDGTIFGTLCHFSLDPCHSKDEEIQMMQTFAGVLLESERLGEIGWRSPKGS